MKTIEPDSIAELKYMPYLLGLLIVLGLAAGISRIKWLFYTWVILFVLLGIAGGIDFWLWEYDYGHNLDSSAAIQVPGMTYQPPLIGGKELLNFYASSWPALGGWIIIAGGIASVGIFFYELFYNKKRVKKDK
jgi:copper chaperone NosL